MGLCGLHRLKSEAPTVGIWVKEQQHGHKFGREAVESLITFAFAELRLEQIYYPVAEENWASRKIAETLGGKIIKQLAQRKYMAVIYEISRYSA
ncbi:GNAT family N-acetyltransferase [Acinetobacter sp. A7.4]|nr:GNAT family N-acetyltransferase [Acinetobacter sp. A7.4]MCJ8160410.1 GNAT family N-acetyltransferase [Acinetobacter sp. A7.4]